MSKEDVCVSRDQLSLVVLAMRYRTEAVDLQFKDELIGIETLCAGRESRIGQRFRGRMKLIVKRGGN
jgi:hypothetical protein